MAEQENKSFKVVDKVKTTELIIQEVEENAIIVNLEGWRMRVYLTEGYEGHLNSGGKIKVNYFGDLEDPHTVRFQKLK